MRYICKGKANTSKFAFAPGENQLLEAGMCRLIAVSIVRNNDVRLIEPHEPLYQLRASDGDGASK